ncbi:MAG: ribose-phosphate pyrophosphokinase, partial [Chloroflexota bacterium]|nr:ribose-phosphate pyrophosphokinase [Chloroflexota bacterium]
MADELKVFSGNTHPELTQAICDYLGMPPGQIDVFDFSNENVFVRILENVRGRDVFLVQPVSTPVNTSLMELLVMIDAAKRASAERITAVLPYFGYSRTDKKDQPRVPITARLVADLLTVAGAGRVLTIDLHAGQIQGFFNIPVDELTALYILSNHFEEKQLDDMVVVATDVGISKRARDLAERLNAPLAIIEKRRIGNSGHTEAHRVIGDVKGKPTILFDDEIDSAGSITSAAVALEEHGAKDVYACCTHPILSGKAMERIAKSPLKEVVVTDSIPVPESKRIDKITVLSLAPLIGEAIHRIHANLSV